MNNLLYLITSFHAHALELNCVLIASIVKEGLVNYFLGINRLDRIDLLTPRLFGFRQSSVVSRALLPGYFVVLV